VSLLDITAAFGSLANGGIAIRPTMVRKAIDRSGDPAWMSVPGRSQAVSPQGARVLTALLEGVMRRGTAAKANSLGLEGAVAGKTGTTDGYRDAWFVGYSPDIVIGVWIGFDDERALGLTGAQAALPIWMDVARQVISSQPKTFGMPTGVVTREIDPKTGQLATSQCPERSTEMFIENTEPTVYCEVHGGGLWERLKRTFGFS
jgi:penicillin-binding protein 1B